MGLPGHVREFTFSGKLVQTFTFPSAPPGDGQPRSIVLDGNGNIDIYNGFLHPVLTTLNPVTGNVIHNASVSGWSTLPGGTSFGGLAAFGKFVFATNMPTSANGGADGLIRFNIDTFSATRFASDPVNGSYLQDTIGRNGLLYAVGAPGNRLDVFNPDSLALVKRINIDESLDSVAVDKHGVMFGVIIDDPRIFEFDSTGQLINTLTTPFQGFTQIAFDDSGRLVASTNGPMLITDESLSSFTVIDPGIRSVPGSTFLAFVEPPLGPGAVPEPGSLALLNHCP